MAAAVARALVVDLHLGEEAVEAAVAASEAVFHGSASGIDQAAALTGGVFEFERGVPPKITPIRIPPVQLVVIEAGLPALTSDMVTGVASRLSRRKTTGRKVLAAIREVVAEASSALQAGDWASVGELMDMNHGLLKALGVSTPELDRACEDAVAAGALGAKITGAGGGGCVIALTPNRGAEVSALMAERGWKSFTVEIN
jgi:mevalonate kinase